ncbi:hypothetical protein KUTeg_014895 [Tegillarca granosa]|uniref:glycerophosphocholine cholinephosphodiesterase n=1 Tax=Tegillarca granosa TaxID=220873 RepID=A0ABQ9ER19_TEGGR|nr:hypothetical protein KUTeg_014895 [Tegillarca granosa]
MAFFSYVEATKGSKLIVIMVDGFKWNYFEKPGLVLPGFREIIKNGVRLHCESHGMVGNYMYDGKHNETFLIYQNKPVSLHSYWWSGGEPVWITAVRQGKPASLFHWAGCEVMIKGHNSSFCKKYTDIPSIQDLNDDIDEAVNQLKSDKADLIGIYVEQSDSVGHNFGPNSKKLRDTLIQIDLKIQKLMALLKENNLENDVNVMIFSDHGMAEISTSRIINITGSINMADVNLILDIGATVNIWPAEGKLEKVYQDLKKMNNQHLRVFKKEEIPERWFLKNHYRVPPIFLVADNGWFILTTNYRIKPFANVNLYQMMCHLLGITPAPHNGTWSTVSDMLIDNEISSSEPRLYSVLSLIISCVLLTSSITVATKSGSNNKLVLFLLDGVRWDYLDQEVVDLPGFKRIIREGVKADYMVPDMPTLSYPNYYSLMTGKCGKRAYMYQWPGCEVDIRGYKPTFCEVLNRVPTIKNLQDSVDAGIKVLTEDKADLVDKEINRMIETLEKKNILDSVNIMIFSDHGMTPISESRVVDISPYVDMNDIDIMLEQGPNCYIWPKDGKLEKPKKSEFLSYSETGPMKGFHGYAKEEEDMRAIFTAAGPDFKRNYRIKPFLNIQLYQIMCRILNITPQPHNGTWSEVKDMLIGEQLRFSVDWWLVIVSVSIFFILLVFKRYKENVKNSFKNKKLY